jgi:hypothetical protein
VERARAALQAETEEIVQASKSLNDNLVEAVRRIWRQLLLIWGVVGALAVSYLLVAAYMPPAPPAPGGAMPGTAKTQESPVPPAATSTPDTFPAFPERDELISLLNRVREAQYQKDLQLFLSSYAPTMPELAKKRELALAIWQRFDYLDMHYHVSELAAAGATAIRGKITWDIKARDRKTAAIRAFAKSYRVEFSKQSGQWLISDLEPIE